MSRHHGRCLKRSFPFPILRLIGAAISVGLDCGLYAPEQLLQRDLSRLLARRLAVRIEPSLEFPTVSSCVVAGGSTEIVSRVAGPMLTNANPFRLNSAMPTAAAS